MGGGVTNYSFMRNMKLLNSNKELLDWEGSLGKFFVHNMSLGAILKKLWWKQHILKNENEGKNVPILPFSADFSYTCWFLCNSLLNLPLATDIWWVSVIFNFIWPVMAFMGLIVKFLLFSPWKITFCWKNILSDTCSGGYPVRKCEFWLDLTYMKHRKIILQVLTTNFMWENSPRTKKSCRKFLLSLFESSNCSDRHLYNTNKYKKSGASISTSNHMSFRLCDTFYQISQQAATYSFN